ncbi:HlyD family type I secretion periplasmic adaptor subunit [Azospirillum sp. sgz301742]
MNSAPLTLGSTREQLAAPYSPPSRPDPVGSAPDVRRTVLVVVATILFGFGGFFGWAALFRLESAAIAPGVVSVESHRKVVQHLEGGIVKALLAANGDRVRAGDLLIQLDDTQARATYGQTLGQHRAVLARRARLYAEATGRPAVDFPQTLLKDRNDPEVQRVIDAQVLTFEARRTAHISAIAVKRQALMDIKADTAAATEQIAATTKQIAKTVEEIADLQKLFKKDLVPKPRILALERNEAELQGRMAELRGRVARNREGLTSISMQITDLEAVRQKDIAAELEAVDKEAADLSQRLGGQQDVLRRTAITAPQDGVVVNLQVFTSGGVVRGGEPLMEIVPGLDALVVDTKVNPMDIDSVHTGLKARVRLTAYQQRTTPTVLAEVIDVSADRLTDQAGNSHYTARLRLNQAELDALPWVHLSPGMPVEAMIITGERSVLDYLLTPITNGFAHALREQ